METHKLLQDVLPKEFLNPEYKETKARKFANVPVIRTYQTSEKAWPGTRKNVSTWFALGNGRAVAINENPGRGLTFQVIRYKEKESAKAAAK